MGQTNNLNVIDVKYYQDQRLFEQINYNFQLLFSYIVLTILMAWHLHSKCIIQSLVHKFSGHFLLLLKYFFKFISTNLWFHTSSRLFFIYRLKSGFKNRTMNCKNSLKLWLADKVKLYSISLGLVCSCKI